MVNFFKDCQCDPFVLEDDAWLVALQAFVDRNSPKDAITEHLSKKQFKAFDHLNKETGIKKMININVVMGPSGAGKSTYIQKHRKDEDLVIDVLEYQKQYLGYNILFYYYMFLADIEVAIHQSKEEKTIWIENTFLLALRRKMFLDWFRTLSKGYKVPIKFNLICCLSEKVHDEMLEDPREYDKNLGWDTFQTEIW